MVFIVEKGSEKDSQKGFQEGVSRRCLERPLGEYDPLGVRPNSKTSGFGQSAPLIKGVSLRPLN